MTVVVCNNPTLPGGPCRSQARLSDNIAPRAAFRPRDSEPYDSARTLRRLRLSPRDIAARA